MQIYTHIGYLSLFFSWSLCFKISALLLTELKDFRSTVAIDQHTGPHWTSSTPKISPHASTLSPGATQGAASAVASPDLPKHRQGGWLPACSAPFTGSQTFASTIAPFSLTACLSFPVLILHLPAGAAGSKASCFVLCSDVQPPQQKPSTSPHHLQGSWWAAKPTSPLHCSVSHHVHSKSQEDSFPPPHPLKSIYASRTVDTKVTDTQLWGKRL